MRNGSTTKPSGQNSENFNIVKACVGQERDWNLASHIENKWAIIAYYVRGKCHGCVWYQNFLIFFCEFLVLFLSMTITANTQKHGT